MRVGAYDPTVQKCSNCLCWFRVDKPVKGKFPGLCRHDPPRVTHKRTAIPVQVTATKAEMQIIDADSSGWPTTMEDDSCYQHVALLSQ